jgi:hypothetical protein
MCSRESLFNAWVDPSSCNLVDKTLDVLYSPHMCFEVTWSMKRRFWVDYQDTIMCDLILLSQYVP